MQPLGHLFGAGVDDGSSLPYAIKAAAKSAPSAPRSPSTARRHARGIGYATSLELHGVIGFALSAGVALEAPGGVLPDERPGRGARAGGNFCGA